MLHITVSNTNGFIIIQKWIRKNKTQICIYRILSILLGLCRIGNEFIGKPQTNKISWIIVNRWIQNTYHYLIMEFLHFHGLGYKRNLDELCVSCSVDSN